MIYGNVKVVAVCEDYVTISNHCFSCNSNTISNLLWNLKCENDSCKAKIFLCRCQIHRKDEPMKAG